MKRTLLSLLTIIAAHAHAWAGTIFQTEFQDFPLGEITPTTVLPSGWTAGVNADKHSTLNVIDSGGGKKSVQFIDAFAEFVDRAAPWLNKSFEGTKGTIVVDVNLTLAETRPANPVLQIIVCDGQPEDTRRHLVTMAVHSEGEIRFFDGTVYTDSKMRLEPGAPYVIRMELNQETSRWHLLVFAAGDLGNALADIPDIAMRSTGFPAKMVSFKGGVNATGVALDPFVQLNGLSISTP
jgi:hypothetical protein